MSEQKLADSPIQQAVAALGQGALDESLLCTYIHPLFSQVLRRKEIYLANHSLGRPLDQTALDVQAALTSWYENMDGAWDDWLAEVQTFRQQIACLLHAPSHDCIVPKTSAGQGLRAILNCFDNSIPVVATTAEFNSIDHILKVYAERKRLTIQWVQPDDQGMHHEEDLLLAVREPGTLFVVSMVLFTSGQYLSELKEVIAQAQAKGAYVLLDVYHALGVLPIDIQALNADFAIGGSYKYLRGGPGACWLYVHPRHLTGNFQTLDTGWFAQPHPFDFDRKESGQYAPNGNAFLESTPAILPFYQAKAGIELTLELGVERLRAYSLHQQALFLDLLTEQGVSVSGIPKQRGAFLAIPHKPASQIAEQLKKRQIVVDAREGRLRICPDILTTETELLETANQLGSILKSIP